MSRGGSTESRPLQDVARVDAVLALAIGGVAIVEGGGPRLRYRRVGDRYSAEHACSGTVLAVNDDGVRIGFTLPTVAQAEFVELQLACQAGRYRIDRLSVDGCSIDDIGRRVVQAIDVQLRDLVADEVCIESSERPPLVEIDLRGLRIETSTTGMSLELEILRADAVAIGLERVRRATEESSLALRTMLLAQGDHVFEFGREQRLLVESQRIRGDAHDARLRDHQTSLADVRGAIEAASLRADETMRTDSDARAAALQSQTQVAASMLVLTEAVGSQCAEISALRSDLARMQASIENVFWRRWARRLRGQSQ